jgi:carbon starvation protein
MMLPLNSPLADRTPNILYALGVGNFLNVVGIPASFGVAFGLMAFTTFVYDTLDVCTRLGRYILQELFGATGWKGRWLATALTAGAPLGLLLWQPASGSGQAAWKVFWNLFGASNQLLAALTLLGVTVWLWQTRRAWWVWPVVGLPCVWMYVISMWALIEMVGKGIDFADPKWPSSPVPYVGLILVTLGGLMLFEAIAVLLRNKPLSPVPAQLEAAVE